MVKFSWSLAIKLFLHLISDLWRGNKCIAFFLYLYPVEQCTMFFFFYQSFLSRILATHSTQGKGGDLLLCLSTTSTRSRTFRHLFATLHVRWLSHIFNRNACIYQTATRWYLPPYRITIWLIDDVVLIFVCLLIWF